MLRRICCTFILLLYCSLFALSYNQIKNDPSYLIGLGKAENFEKANQLALNDLITQISVTVQSQFNYVLEYKLLI